MAQAQRATGDIVSGNDGDSAGHTIDADGLFFIVGTGRCGSTLLQAMLASHSRITIPPETKFFQRHDADEWCKRLSGDPEWFAKYLDDWFASPDWREMNLEEAVMRRVFIEQTDHSSREVFLALMQALSGRGEFASKPRLGEKSPLHCRKVRRILEVFPQAKFIHIYRDPRDVVASMRRMAWTDGSIRDLARDWRVILNEHLALTRELPGAVYASVRFESLVQEPEGELGRLCAFLGETFEPDTMLRFHERSESGFHEREVGWKGLTRQPLTTQSIGKYREALTTGQIATIERLCARPMQAMGYEFTTSVMQRRNPLRLAGDQVGMMGCKAKRWMFGKRTPAPTSHHPSSSA